MRLKTLEVGSDGRARVTVMTDPIPRHISIVDWGSNGVAAQSWRRHGSMPAETAAKTLRSTPNLSPEAGVLKRNVEETCSALRALVIDVLGLNISAAERQAQVKGFFAQAGARLAVIAKSLGTQSSARAAAAYRNAVIKRPERPDGTSFESELAVREFEAWLDRALAYMADDTMRTFQDAEKQASADGLAETILAIASWTGWDLSWYVGYLPDGQVGARRSTRSTTSPQTSQEPTDMITSAELLIVLRKLATEEPASFIELSILATDSAHKRGMAVKPTPAMRASWGETGVQTEVPVQNQLGLANADIEGLVSKALSGIDFTVIPSGAAFVTTMRAAIAAELTTALRADMIKSVKDEIANDKSELTAAVRAAVATSVVESMRKVLNSRQDPEFFAPSGEGAGGKPEDDVDPFVAALPGRR